MPGLRYREVEIGDPIGPAEYEVTGEVADDYHESIDVSHPRFTSEDSRLVEPTILGRFASETVSCRYPGEGRIYAQGEFEFSSPVRVGQTVIAEGEISDKYQERGRKYVEFDVKLRTDDGTRLGRNVSRFVVEANR